MSSPFPGMDPYIEDPEVWSDFHGGLADEMRAQLNSVLQPRYVARLTPRVTYDIIEVAERRNVRPDVGMWQPQPPSGDMGELLSSPPHQLRAWCKWNCLCVSTPSKSAR